MSQSVCTQCQRSFSRSNDLKRHKAQVHDKVVFTCPEPQCVGKKWCQKAKYLAHKKTKHDNERFMCDRCGQDFSDPSTVTRHKDQKHPGTVKKRVTAKPSAAKRAAVRAAASSAATASSAVAGPPTGHACQAAAYPTLQQANPAGQNNMPAFDPEAAFSPQQSITYAIQHAAYQPVQPVALNVGGLAAPLIQNIDPTLLNL